MIFETVETNGPDGSSTILAQNPPGPVQQITLGPPSPGTLPISKASSVSSLTVCQDKVAVQSGESVDLSAFITMADGTINTDFSITPFSFDEDVVQVGQGQNGKIEIRIKHLPSSLNEFGEDPLGQTTQIITATIHPNAAGTDKSLDQNIYIEIIPNDYLGIVPPVSANCVIPLFTKQLSSGFTLDQLSPDELEMLTNYYTSNPLALPPTFIPGSFISDMIGLGDFIPNSTNGLPVKAAAMGYVFENGRYRQAFVLPEDTNLILNPNDPLTDPLVDQIADYTIKGIDYTGKGIATGVMIKLIACGADCFDVYYPTFIFEAVHAQLAFLTNPVTMAIGITAGIISGVNELDKKRKLAHYKQDDSQIADDMMSNIRLIMDTYNSNRAPTAEEEKGAHDLSVLMVGLLFNSYVEYFKLPNSVESQKVYVEQFIQTMDQTLNQRLTDFETP